MKSVSVRIDVAVWMTEIDVIISGVDVAMSDVLLISSDDEFTSLYFVQKSLL